MTWCILHTWFIQILIFTVCRQRYVIIALHIRVVYFCSVCVYLGVCYVPNHMICKNDSIAILPLHANVVKIWCFRLSTSLVSCLYTCIYLENSSCSLLCKNLSLSHKKKQNPSISFSFKKTPHHCTLTQLTTQLLPVIYFSPGFVDGIQREPGSQFSCSRHKRPFRSHDELWVLETWHQMASVPMDEFLGLVVFFGFQIC